MRADAKDNAPADGLGGCGPGGAPFATIQGAFNWVAAYVDLANSDPFTIQFCPGDYGVGEQTLHAPTIITGRNGGAGMRLTGSPGDLRTCADRNAVSIGADSTTPVFDAELPYTWIFIDCMSLTTMGAPMISANRGSTVVLGDGLVLGGNLMKGAPQIIIGNRSTIQLSDGATITITDDADYFAVIYGKSSLYPLGDVTIKFDGKEETYDYKSLFLMAGDSFLNLGKTKINVNGTLNGLSYTADESFIFSELPIPGKDGVLTGGACISGITNRCAAQALETDPGALPR